jgi:hypothetical protein
MAEYDYRAIEQELRSKMPAPFHPAQNPLGPTVEVAEAEGEPRVLIQLPKSVTISMYDQPAAASIAGTQFCAHCGAKAPKHRPGCSRPTVTAQRRIVKYHYRAGTYRAPRDLLTFPWVTGALRDWQIHPALTEAGIELLDR